MISPPNNIIELPIRKGMKFCVKDGDIEYKFAITFPSPPPGPVNEIKSIDAVKQENSVVLQWKFDERASNFNIYFSEKDFINEKISDIKNDAQIRKATVNAVIPTEIGKIDLANCQINNIGQKCVYGLYNKPLENNKLYLSEGKFIYLLSNIPDDKQHNFAVTSADAEGNEIDNDKSIIGNNMIFIKGKNYATFLSKDDLEPNIIEDIEIKDTIGKLSLSWKKPQKNIEGSALFDVAFFNIYYKKTTSELPPTLDPTYLKKQISTTEAGCESVNLDCSYEMQLEPGLYNVAITALDEKSNEFKIATETKQILVN